MDATSKIRDDFVNVGFFFYVFVIGARDEEQIRNSPTPVLSSGARSPQLEQAMNRLQKSMGRDVKARFTALKFFEKQTVPLYY